MFVMALRNFFYIHIVYLVAYINSRNPAHGIPITVSLFESEVEEYLKRLRNWSPIKYQRPSYLVISVNFWLQMVLTSVQYSWSSTGYIRKYQGLPTKPARCSQRAINTFFRSYQLISEKNL